MLQFDDAVRAEADRATSMSSGTTRVVNRAHVELLGNQLSRAQVRGHEFLSDEPEQRGGTDQGPAPLEYLLAGLGFCQEVMIARNAATRDVRLEAAEISIRGYFDPRGGHLEGVENQGFEEIRIDVAFESPEDPDVITDLMEAADRQCYALNTLRRAATIHQTIRLNGDEIAARTYDAERGP